MSITRFFFCPTSRNILSSAFPALAAARRDKREIETLKDARKTRAVGSLPASMLQAKRTRLPHVRFLHKHFTTHIHANYRSGEEPRWGTDTHRKTSRANRRRTFSCVWFCKLPRTLLVPDSPRRCVYRTSHLHADEVSCTAAAAADG